VKVLLKLTQSDKAEELYNILLEQTSDEDEKPLYYNQLGFIKRAQGDYNKAIEYYEKRLEIQQKKLFLQIILISLNPTIISDWCMTTSGSFRKRSNILNALLTSCNVHYLLITLIFKMAKGVWKE